MLRLLVTANSDMLRGGGLAGLHDRLREEALACVELAAAFIRALDITDEQPLARALASVAAEADRSGLANAFHNPAHAREVGVNWWLLARLHGSAAPALSRDAIMTGLIAAFGHDLHHDGQGNGLGSAHVPFRLESIAAATATEILRQAGVSTDIQKAVSAMILCTDVQAGYPYFDGARLDDARVAPLADETVLLSARMLRDADLLPSAGTSIAAYRARSAELEREAGLPPGALSGDAASGFFDRVVERRFLSPAAQGFIDMLRAIAADATGR